MLAPRARRILLGRSMDAWSVVTGAGSGIGAALARRLGSKGFRVLAVGRRAEKLQETASGCEQIVPCPADVGSREGRDRIVSALGGEKVRFLVHSAAVGVPNGIKDVKEEDFEDAMRINVTGPLFLNQALLPLLSACEGSRILHLGTGLAHGPSAQPGSITYSVSKAAFHRLYEQMKVELKPSGVLVGSARPGVVASEGMLHHIAMAREAGLGHVAWFDGLLARGEDMPAERVARFLEFLLVDAKGEEYAEKEWHIADESHRSRWDW